jgi:hypothetical protein
MATLIPADETTEVTTIPTPKGLEEHQALVGGYIELIPLGDGRTLMVNEEGLLRRGLPVNRRATVLCSRGPLVGDAVLFERGEID